MTPKRNDWRITFRSPGFGASPHELVVLLPLPSVTPVSISIISLYTSVGYNGMTLAKVRARAVAEYIPGRTLPSANGPNCVVLPGNGPYSACADGVVLDGSFFAPV